MNFDRVSLKKRTKQMVRQGTPPVWQVTLFYLLATTWVSTLISLVLANPFEDAMAMLSNWYTQLINTTDVTSGMLSVMQQQVMSCFQGPVAAVGMLVALVVAFYTLVVDLGYTGYMLKTMRGQEAGPQELFSHFDLAGKLILLAVLKAVFIYFWSLLFLFPGIIAAYRYRMASYCLLDDPEISALEAIRRSKALMKGNKLTLWVLDLTFLGWSILMSVVVECLYSGISPLAGAGMASVVSTLGGTVIALFVTSYISLTEAGFYLALTAPQAPPVDEPVNGFDVLPEQEDRSYEDEGWSR